MRHALPFALLLYAAGCAGSSSSSRHGGDVEVGNRHFDDECLVTYDAEHDITLVLRPISNVEAIGAVFPGDGWSGSCIPDGNRLVHAENRAMGRIATVTVDTSVRGPVDVEAYAEQQRQYTVDAMRAQGVSSFEAMPARHIGEGVYVLAMRANASDGLFLQLNAHRVIPTPDGLPRVHISETNDDADALSEHGVDLVASVQAFGIIRLDD